MEIITTFDYGQLDTEARIVVKQRTLEIKAQVKHSAHAIADIGSKLVEVRSILQDGEFTSWLQAEFEWTRMTAYRFIQVFEKFGCNNLLLDNAAPSALYLLAGMPEEDRQEFVNKAETGQRVTHREVKARKPKTGGYSGGDNQITKRTTIFDEVYDDFNQMPEDNSTERVSGFTLGEVVEMLSKFKDLGRECPFCGGQLP